MRPNSRRLPPDDADRVLGAAALAPGPTPARTPTENLGRVVLVVVGLVVVASLVGTIASGVGGAARSHPAAPQPASLQPQAAAPASSPAPVVTAPPTVQYQWQEIEERFRQPGLTSMQKDQMTDALQGSWVQMTGEVSDVGTMLASTYIGMRCNSSTLTSDTHVSMSPGQTPELAQLRKGQVITVIAQFLSHGMLGHSYRNGRLVR